MLPSNKYCVQILAWCFLYCQNGKKKPNIIDCCAADPQPFSLGERLGGKRYFGLWVMKLDLFTCCEIESSWMGIKLNKMQISLSGIT